MTIAVVLGQVYVGLGYRMMTDSVIELIERADPIHRPRLYPIDTTSVHP